MNTILYQCSKCSGKHALCKLVGKRTTKLGLMCHLDKNKPPQFVPLAASICDNIQECDVKDIPVYYTAQGRKIAETKGNLQFIMPLVKEGETVERRVDLGGNDFRPKVESLKRRIDKILNEAKAIDNEIMLKQRYLKSLREDAHALSAELSKYQTGDLFKE